ncbi:TIGR04141 family sporadically distributed protein [Caldifermentibacillus hisashii]|uniref:DUF6119 family protein n=1 Tax=Caldifermentibacillus hisashii TaxID=996558 RepID=UPI002E20C71B|nr:TIGR04141 family sporadically distributed protein [Caldifermentibacillus hisashii]
MEWIKILKSKNLNIFLLKNNFSSFKKYLKEEYQKKRVRRHYIDKQKIAGNIEKSIIYIYEETLPQPDWVEYLNTLSAKKDIKVSPKKSSKAVLFLTIRGIEKKTFAITFGHGSTLLNPDYIVPDFGTKISKSLLSLNQILSIDSTSIDRKIFNTKKQSAEFLIPEKILEYDTQNIVKNIYGIYKEFDQKFSIGGNDSLKIRGNINLLKDLEKWLIKFTTLYSKEEDHLGIQEDLIIADKNEQQDLDKKLGQKILDITNTNPITGKQISMLKIAPNEVFDLADFNGFFISGLGYKKSETSSDFFIDTLNYFIRFKRQLKPEKKNVEGILNKIKTDKIYIKTNDGELKPICTIYKALNYETTLNSKTYILNSGIWYEIDKEFYSNLKKDINSIPSPDSENNIFYIDFNSKIHYKMVNKNGNNVPQLSEGKYNEDLTKQNHILMLDRQDYRVDTKTMKKYGFKSQSSIEICDALYFTQDKIQFIHIKRHSNASGTSHLLTQALVSAHAFINDNQSVINHINHIIQEFNQGNKSYNILKLENKNQKKEIVLALIDKKENIKKENSKLLSLLEMISIRQNIRTLEYMGFKCYLKFIAADK